MRYDYCFLGRLGCPLHHCLPIKAASFKQITSKSKKLRYVYDFIDSKTVNDRYKHIASLSQVILFYLSN